MVASDGEKIKNEIGHNGKWELAYLIVDAFVECDTQRPPIDFKVIATTLVHLWGEIREGSRLACERLTWSKVRRHILG